MAETVPTARMQRGGRVVETRADGVLQQQEQPRRARSLLPDVQKGGEEMIRVKFSSAMTPSRNFPDANAWVIDDNYLVVYRKTGFWAEDQDIATFAPGTWESVEVVGAEE